MFRLFRLLPALLVCVLSMWAQTDRGTISGVVTDSTGAAIPAVRIDLTNARTNAKLQTVSTNTGAYRVVGVEPGLYTLTAQMEGFQTYVRPDVHIQVNQSSTLDIPMEIGEVTQTITVEGGVPLIQTESSEVGLVVEAREFLNLPLTLGGGIRNPASFIKLAPGVSPNSTWNRTISGGGSFQDMTYYDGIALSRGDLSNDSEVNPSVDAIQEFKLITNNYSAEYSHALGGITSYTMKSGTNDIHGTGFYFVRNEKLDARGFFPASRAPAKQNEWGGTIGGPILLPKLYNGKNRSFFFFSFDQFYRRGGQLAGLNTLPTARMLQGDFSELPRTIYDPASTTVGADGKVTRTPFAGNIIPKERWSRISSQFLPFHPVPELPGIQANSIAPLASPLVDQQTWGFKLNHVFNDQHRVSGMFNKTFRPSVKSPGPSRLIPVGDTTALANYNDQNVTTHVIHVNLDSNLNATTLNHIGLGFSRFRNPNFSQSFNQGWVQPNGGKLGLTGLQFDLFPTVQFDTEGYTRYGDNIASDNYFNTYSALDTLSLVRGNHTIKIGAEVQYHQDTYRNFGTGGGDFRFRRESTGLPGVSNSGDAWASFLLGDVYRGNAFFKATDPTGRYINTGVFVDDIWKVTQRLTLNLGIRLEFIRPHVDPAGRLSYMDITAPNPGAGGLPGAMVYGGDQGFGTQLLETMWWNPAPRAGFAYRITDRTVIRGGGGIFNANYINQGLGLPAFGFTTNASFETGDVGVTPAFNWDGGFPQEFQKPPITGADAANGQGVTAVLPTQYNLPYKIQWNLTLEHQFTDSLSMSFAYVANKGTHLYEQQQINQIPDGARALPVNVLNSRVGSALALQNGVTEPYPGFLTQWGSRGTVAQALRPFPQYNNVSIYGSTYGNSSYQSFQYSLTKRYGSGLSGTVAYTFSKFLSDARQFDGFVAQQSAYQREKSYHPSDQPHIFTFSFSYDLPFGPGRNWMTTGVGSKVFGGWQLAGVASYASGSRLSVTTNNNLPYFNPARRVDIVSENIRTDVSMSAFDPAIHAFLNKDAFANPPAGQFGSAPRYLRELGPTSIDESFAVIKNTTIGERLTHQFRLEMVNPFNRVVFGDPNTNFTSPNFGRITSTQLSPRNIQLGMKFIF